MAIALEPPEDEDYDHLVRCPISIEFQGEDFELGAMLFDPEEVSMPEVMEGLAQYLHQVADGLEFRREFNQELNAMFSEIEGNE